MSEYINKMQLLMIRSIEESSDNSVIAKLIMMFEASTPDILVELHSSIKNLNFKEIAFLSHKLRSSCLNLGIQLMGDICLEMESNARMGIPVDYFKYVIELDRQFPIVVAELRAWSV